MYTCITNIKVNDGQKSAILNLIELQKFRAYIARILLYSNDLAIWHSSPDIYQQY